MGYLIQFGYVGMFLISLVGALTVIFPIPYTLLLYALGATLDPVLLAFSSGLGSALGEVSGYLIGYYGRAVISDALKRKMEFMLKVFNRYGSLAVFLFALTPLPDDLLFIPLGIMRYSLPRALIACFFGKLGMSFIIAYSCSSTPSARPWTPSSSPSPADWAPPSARSPATSSGTMAARSSVTP